MCMDRIRCELKWLGENLKTAGLGAFLAAAGCVMLWVSGGSGWYALKALRRSLPPLGLLFTLSLLRAGFCGLAAAVCVVCGREGWRKKRRLPAAAGWIGAAYLFGLGWYAVFFCTRMILFGAVLLCGGILALSAAGGGAWKRKLPLSVWLGLVPALLLDLFFLILTLLTA